MNDLKRMESFYSNKSKNEWSIFNCYPYYLDCRQTGILINILNSIKLQDITLLDIGAGEGNFILKLIMLGVEPRNITAIEYLKNRYEKLKNKISNINAINSDFNKVNLKKKYDLITIMAVLTSITDNDIRYNIVSKSLDLLNDDGILIIYDFFDDSEKYLSDDYRAVSLKKILNLSSSYKVSVYKNVYLNAKFAKGLCKINLGFLIPIFEKIRIFNDKYSFMVIKNAK